MLLALYSYLEVLSKHREVRLTVSFLLGARKETMVRGILMMTMFFPLVAGCESYSWSVYNNPSIRAVKEGRDCRVLVFGLGGSVDPTGVQAMHLGDITKVRSTEYRVNTLQGVGNECVIAHGE
jgi:hypothetical protein